MPGITHTSTLLPGVQPKFSTTMSAEDVDNGDINNNDEQIELNNEVPIVPNEMNSSNPPEGNVQQEDEAANFITADGGNKNQNNKVCLESLTSKTESEKSIDNVNDENVLNGHQPGIPRIHLEKINSLSITSNTPYDSIEAESRRENDISHMRNSSDEFSGSDIEFIDSWQMGKDNKFNSLSISSNSEINVITSNDTLSAVICLEEGLADDDSWVEELDHDDLPECQEDLSESSDFEDIPFMEEIRYNHPDLTLHTIYEESGEDSGAEEVTTEVRPTELEKYFVFEIGGSNSTTQVAQDADSVSESSSTVSESTEVVKEHSSQSPNPADLVPSRLEKYFLSGFMGFHKRDSDSSVGSDSEGRQSPEQRRRKVIRPRSSNRPNSQDNLNEEQQADSDNQYESSDVDSNEEDTNFDKSDGQFDTVKRTKKKKRTLMVVAENEVELVKEKPNEDKTVTVSSDFPIKTLEIEYVGSTIECLNSITSNHGLSRKDSFNNWSSDEETNLMMSKMRTFFKTMIAQQKNASSVVKSKSKPPQLVYFESELTRLMKTVPGLREDQVKEIVEYLSSEDTWSDSYDSSDYTSSDLDSCKVPGISMDGKKNLDLVYHCLLSSFQNEQQSDTSKSRNSPPLMNKVMQHIGSRLVALMHEVSEGHTVIPKSGRNQRRPHSKLPTVATTTEEEDDSADEQYPLPRSKSYDPLMEEGRQEASDNERFSWRGSFESALMTGSDSRTRLPSAGETSASALALAAAKRRSAGDLLFKSANNSREHLDRVRSCGSIGEGVEDKIWSMRHGRKRRSSVPEAASNSGESADGENDSDENEDVMDKSLHDNIAKSTTLPRTLQNLCNSTTNSLPRLLSSSPTTNIYKVNNSHQFGVKSARYRPPGYNNRNSSGSFHTLSAPPRRDYNRRRYYSPHILSSVTVLSPGSGTGDDCSVASDVSERTGILDDVSERSHSRISTVSVTRSDSMASVYSGAGEGRYGVVPVRGEVEFSLQYNYKAGDVEIHVKRCSDLSSVDVKRNRSDPYVKVYLLPDKSKSGKRKTRVKKHTLNPVFDEVLKYHISLEELESRTLWLSVWHSDIFGRNDFLGEVVVPLVNKVFDDPTPKMYILKERSEILDNVSNLKGELIVALKFVLPSDNKGMKRGKEIGSVQVLIKEAKNLTAAKSNGTSDPFCKSYLLPNKGRSCKQKTPVLKRTCHPVWNHTFSYSNVTLDELSQRCLELTIWDHDRLASNEFLGGVRLSLGTGLHNDRSVDWMDSNYREVALWQKMIDHPNFWVENSLILRPSLEGRNNKT